MALAVPQMQVDLPGLTQLIMNVGSYGLKQLSMAGVDLHSVGCMLMIAEFVPACPSFRKTLNRARELQRSEKLWMFKVVEIGTASNFLAEQFLKTRAGENVLALFSATASMLDDAACLTAINGLFEGAEISPDNIPGTSQLQNIRNDLAPLAKRTGFRERVLQHHELLARLRHGTSRNARSPGISTATSGDPYDALPHASQIPKIMRMLHKITTSDQDQIMIMNGLTGAAWVITYAVSVLDLHTSVVQHDQDPFPIYGPFESAKVLIQLSSDDFNCALYKTGDLQDVFDTQQAPTAARKGWSVDCTLCNFLELRHPRTSSLPFFSRMSYFTALEALNEVSTKALSFGRVQQEGFVLTFLPELHARCLRILHLLGFRPGTLELYNSDSRFDCRAFDWIGHATDPEVVLVEGEGTRFNAETSRIEKIEYKDQRGHYKSRGSTFSSRLRLLQYLDTTRENLTFEGEPILRKNRNEYAEHSIWSWDQSQQEALVRSIEAAVNFASTLAFTDWDSSLRTMSVRYMSYGLEYAKPESHSNGVFEGHTAEALQLCTDSLDLATIETKLWNMDWIAIDVEEMVLIRNASQFRPLHQLRGKFLTFQTGRILLNGEKCHHVRADRSDLRYRTDHKLVTQKFPSNQWFSERPFSLQLKSLCTVNKGAVFVRNEVYQGNKLYCIVDPSRPSEFIPELRRVSSCAHDPSIVPQRQRILETSDTMLMGGLSFDAEDFRQVRIAPNSVFIYYQQTLGDYLAQWLACHWVSSGNATYQFVLRDSCVDCFFISLSKFINNIRASDEGIPTQGLHICIIDARPVDGRRHSRNPSPAINDATSSPNTSSFPDLPLRPTVSSSSGGSQTREHLTVPDRHH